MADKTNGGLAVSYNDEHLSHAEKMDVIDEIQTIISQMEAIISKEM